ncbi:MAG: M15 family metallopeptidase [Bradymonadia bacterium]
MRALIPSLLLAALTLSVGDAGAESVGDAGGEVCTYRTSSWHVKKKKVVGRKKVRKTRAELTDEEKDPDDPRCTVCSEDQTTLELEGLPKVTVCKHHAEAVSKALLQAKESGFKIKTLIGYRVGRTRGKVVDDLRTQFSNHSYGTAIDVNAGHNGLYARCALKKAPKTAADIKRCSLRVGGAWDPEKRPKTTVVEGGPVHSAFGEFWKWGGTIEGRIKDFMHFSITGR